MASRAAPKHACVAAPPPARPHEHRRIEVSICQGSSPSTRQGLLQKTFNPETHGALKAWPEALPLSALGHALRGLSAVGAGGQVESTVRAICYQLFSRRG